MKTFIKNTLATTGLSLIALAVIAKLSNANYLFLSSVFETLLANILIHVGLILIRKIECKFFIIESLAEASYILLVVIVCGYFFGWYSSTPPWILTMMSLIIYIAGCTVGVLRINDDLREINKELKKRADTKEIET